MKRLSIFLPLLIAATVISCKKENSLVANPSLSKPTIAFQIRAINPFSAVGRLATSGITSRADGNNIKWNSATASVSMIKFEAKKDGNEVEFKSAVQQTVDLLQISDIISNLSIADGVYDQVEFKVTLNPNGNKPALEIKGQLTNGTAITNVIFLANETIEIKGEKANVTINDSTIHKAITNVDLSTITQGISLSALINAATTNGDILISSSVNQQLYDIIVKNLRNIGDEESFD